MSWWNPWRSRSVKSAPLDVLRALAARSRAKSGQVVTVERALQVSTVLACARVIGEGLAQVPLRLMHKASDGKRIRREPATEHPLFDVLYREPNPWQTSFEFRESLGLHCTLAGNFYAFKNIVRGHVAELIPFEPGYVTPKQDPETLELSYEVRGRKSGEVRIYPAAAIWHVRGPSWNTVAGLEALQLTREAVGLSLAAEETHARLHANGGNTSGLLSMEGKLSTEQHEKLRKWIEDEHQGADNAWKTMILDNGAKYTRLGMSGVDSEHLATRRYQVEDICRAQRVMPIMVGHSGDGAPTYASAEQLFLAHVVHTLTPWYTRVEQSIDVNLLSKDERRDGYYAKFVIEGLLRGAMKDRSDFLTKLTTNGIMTRNEARETLDLNPIDGLDEPLTPANMTVGAQPEPAPDKSPQGDE